MAYICSRIVRDNTYCLSVSFNKAAIYPVLTLLWDTTQSRDFCGEPEHFHTSQWSKFFQTPAFTGSDTILFYFFSRASKDIGLDKQSQTAYRLTPKRFNKIGTYAVPSELKCDARYKFLWGNPSVSIRANVQSVRSSHIWKIGSNFCLFFSVFSLLLSRPLTEDRGLDNSDTKPPLVSDRELPYSD